MWDVAWVPASWFYMARMGGTWNRWNPVKLLSMNDRILMKNRDRLICLVHAVSVTSV
jgi:hypothetical protein